MDTGHLLKRIRLSMAMTKTEISLKMGITDKTYRKYEEKGVEFDKFVSLLDKLELNVESTKTVRIDLPHSEPIIYQEKTN